VFFKLCGRRKMVLRRVLAAKAIFKKPKRHSPLTILLVISFKWALA
jgi:hypothetical protein